MNNDEMRIAVEKAVEQAFESHMKRHWVEPQLHYDDHRFIESIRWSINIMGKSALIAFSVGALSVIGTVVWLGVQAYLKVKGTISH